MRFDTRFVETLTLRGRCCYGAERMRGNLRKYIFLLLGVLALGFFFYKFRNAITLEGFHWSVVGESLRRANLALLVLSVVTTYVCFAIRAVRWMRFSRTLGETRFWNVYRATLMGFTCTFLLGRAGEPIRPVLIARKDSLSIPHMFGVYVLERVFDMASAIVLAGSALLLFEKSGVSGGHRDHESRAIGWCRAAGGPGGDHRVPDLFSISRSGMAAHGNCSTRTGGPGGAKRWRCFWRDSATACRASAPERSCGAGGIFGRALGAGNRFLLC